MNAAKMRALEEGLNGTARKVYACLLCDQGQNVSQVIDRMIANGAGKPEMSSVQGCLDHFHEIGLARAEPQPDGRKTKYFKVEPRAKVVPLPHTHDEPEPMPEPKTAIERLSSLSTRARDLASQLTLLADSIDEAALEVDEQIARAGQQSARLTQLRALLKDVVGDST